LKFDYRGGPAGRILIDAEACTGCGGCLSVCPTGAITLISDKTEAA
jgi:ferredoxin-type protein NapF